MASNIQEYIKSAGESTARARALLAVVLSAALLLIGTYANVFAGFRGRRLAELQAALDYRVWHKHGDSAAVTGSGGMRPPSYRAAEETWELLRSKRALASDSAAEAEIRADAEALRINLLKDASTVSLPLVGVSIDVGDLWVVASIGLIVLQIGLIYATARELTDVFTTLSIAHGSNDRDDWSTAYDLLAMRQLFTVTAGMHARSRRLTRLAEATWRFVPKLLYWLPTGAQAFGLIVGSQYATRTLARPAESGILGFVGEYYPEMALVLVSGCLTYLVIKLEDRYDRVWTAFKPPRHRRKTATTPDDWTDWTTQRFGGIG